MARRMPFGKYIARLLTDIPTNYLEWLLRGVADLDPFLRADVVDVLRRRLWGCRPWRT